MRWCVPDKALHISFECVVLIHQMMREMMTKALAEAMHPWL